MLLHSENVLQTSFMFSYTETRRWSRVSPKAAVAGVATDRRFLIQRLFVRRFELHAAIALRANQREEKKARKKKFLHHRFFFCGKNITGILNPNTKLKQANTISFNKDESRHPNSQFWSFNLLGFLLEPSFGRSGSSSIFSTRNTLNSAECVLSLQNSYSSGWEH